MTSHLVLDLETILDPAFPPPEDPAKIAAPPMHQIVCLGCMLLEDYKPTRLGLVGEIQSEGDRLSDFIGWLEARRPTLVTWNGRAFDVPVIASRALRHGLSMPWWFHDRSTRYRYSTDGHLDLMDFVSDYGAATRSKLDAYAKLCGFPGKFGTDGSSVAEMHAAGKLAEIGDYCLSDVSQTAAVLLRVELLRGTLTRDGYLEAARALLEFLDAEPRVKAMAEKIDRERFLLAEKKETDR